MLKISINKEMHDEARARAVSLPTWRLSYRGADANDVGVLGEVVVENWLRNNNIEFIDERNETTHDYVLMDTSTFDVKTKDRTIPLRSDYECTVPLYNHEHQQPTYYIFVSLERNKEDSNPDICRFHTAYIAGGMNQAQLEKKGRVFKSGEIDHKNNYEVKFDCINIYVKDVTAPEKVLQKWQRISALAGNC